MQSNKNILIYVSVVNYKSKYDLRENCFLLFLNSIQVVLSGLRKMLFDLVQVWMLCRYDCCLYVAVCCSNCDVVWIELCVFGMSKYVQEVYVKECLWENGSLWNGNLKLVLCRCCVSKSCVPPYSLQWT